MAVGFVVERAQCAAQTDSSLEGLAESREGVRTQDLWILRFLAEGLTFDAVGRRLGISARTARRRMRDLCEEWQVGTTVEAIVEAVRKGLI